MLPLVSVVSLLSVSQLVMETSASLVAGINTPHYCDKIAEILYWQYKFVFLLFYSNVQLSNAYETIRRFSTTHVCVCFECFGPLPTSPSQRVGINGAI